MVGPEAGRPGGTVPLTKAQQYTVGYGDRYDAKARYGAHAVLFPGL
ncbi:MAG: hypothetical protein ACLSUW_07445 [Akkermansia sp.]